MFLEETATIYLKFSCPHSVAVVLITSMHPSFSTVLSHEVGRNVAEPGRRLLYDYGDTRPGEEVGGALGTNSSDMVGGTVSWGASSSYS